jgi:hypothetical protein
MGASSTRTWSGVVLERCSLFLASIDLDVEYDDKRENMLIDLAQASEKKWSEIDLHLRQLTAALEARSKPIFVKLTVVP